MIDQLVPTQGIAGQEIAYRGVLRGTDHDLFNSAHIALEMVEIPNIHDILLPGVGVPYSSSGTFNVSTILGYDNIAGDGDPTFIVDGHYGKSGFEWTADTYSLDGVPYKFKVIADVESIDSSTGSAEGGSLLTITGNGFLTDTSKIEATVNGNACEIESASLHEITCRTSKNEASTFSSAPYPGGSGLKRLIWGDIGGNGVDDIETYLEGDAHVSDILCTGATNVGRGETYKQKMTGLFKAPRTGEYTFYLTSDDNSRVWLSTDATPENKGDPLIDFTSWCNPRWAMLQNDKLKSEPRTLTAGNYYYIEAHHAEGGGGDHFLLGVQVPTDGVVYPNGMFEIQKMTFSLTMIREIQTVEISGSAINGGQLYFVYNNAVTDPIEWPEDADYPTCSSVKSALEGIGTGSLGCEAWAKNGGVLYTITFNSNASEARPLLVPITQALAVFGVQKEILRTQDSTPPMSGNFTITHDGVSSSEFSYNEKASTIQADLNANFPQFAKRLQVEGSSSGDGGEFTFVFGNRELGDISELEVEHTFSGGENDEITVEVVETIAPGASQFWWEVPNEFLYTTNTETQLQLTMDGQPVVCSGDCTYAYEASPSILITSYTDASTITFTGTGFVSTPTITVGGAECADVTVVSDTSITCTKPEGAVGSHFPVVEFTGYGYVGYDVAVTNTIDYTLAITSISPSTGSVQGGTTITINGSGFLPSLTSGTMDSSGSGEDAMKVTIQGTICTIQTATSTQITCKTQAGTDGDNTTTVEVTYKSTVSTVDDTSFSLSDASTPTVTSITPNWASPITKTVLTLAGTNFDPVKENNTVTFEWVSQYANDQHNRDTWPCYVTASTTTEITCTLPGGKSSTYKGEYGYDDPKIMIKVADNDAVYTGTFLIDFQLSSVSPRTGSAAGGTLITLTGTGFAPNFTSNTILLGSDDAFCTIESVTVSATQGNDEITCRSPPKPSNWDGELTVYVLGRVQETAISCADCMWNYNDDSVTPTVASISASNGLTGDNLIITGTNFGTSQSDTSVSFGGTDGTVTSVTDTEIQVTVPEHREESETTVVVTIDNIGWGDVGTNTFTYDCAVSGVSPSSGSNGGQDVTISGSGFHAGYEKTNSSDQAEEHYAITIRFGDIPCTITGSVATNSVTCRIGENSGDEGLQGAVVEKVLETVVGDGVETTTVTLFTCPDDDASCSFDFQNASTPTISGVSPSTLDAPGTLTISGTGFSSTTTDNTVTVGSAACVVQTASATSITCDVTPVAGSNTVDVNVSGSGYATGATTVDTTMTLGSVTNGTGSFAGGQEVTIGGSNFSDDVQVDICGSLCEYVSHTNTEYICKAPLLLTEYSFDQSLNAHVKQGSGVTSYTTDIAKIGTTPLSDTYAVDNAFDGNVNTFYKADTADDCYIGFDAGQDYLFVLESFQFYPEIDNDDLENALGAELEGSDDNSNWTTVYTFKSILATWNRFRPEATDTFKYRYYRLKNATSVSSSCLVAEVVYGGVRVRAGTDTSITCDIKITSAGGSDLATKASGFVYDESATPTVSDISPYYGPVAGGTTVTLTGTGFGTTPEDVSVKVDGYDATVTACTDTSLTFDTGVRSTLVEPTLSINVAGKGYANTIGHHFLYVYLWSEESTWGGETPPSAGQSVHIPAGKNVLYDIPADESVELVLVAIEGQLVFADDFDQTFDAWYIFVRGGKLKMGTELNPRVNKLEVTMHGDRWNTAEIPTYGNKVIAVREGELDIHGADRSVTWTVLTVTANIGDTTITVLDVGDWTAGDDIVLASSDFDMNQAEIVTISDVTGNVVTLTTPLKSRHYGEIETYDTEEIDMRCEVGLLTRNIKIHGSGSYHANPERHGVQIFLFSVGDETSIGRIENMELFNAGQAFALGRYAMHFHMIGNVLESYIKKCAVYHSYNRAVTIHGVHHLTIKQNVAYNAMGHTYFIEDGIETHNVLEENIGIATQRSWSLLMTDQTPATFWITNPQNKWIRNRACGSARYGFWFDFPDSGRPGGPSAGLGKGVCIHGMELGEWTDNVTHSNGRYGLRIFHILVPRTIPCQSYYDSSAADPWATNPAVTANFNGLISYKNIRSGAIAEDAGDVRWNNFKTVDNKFSGLEMTHTEFSKPWESVGIYNALVVGYSNDNASISGHAADNGGSVGIITSQTDGMMVDGVKFVNIGSNQYPFGTESHSQNGCARDFGGREHRIKNITWMDAEPNKKVKWVVPARDWYKLEDTSYTGATGYLATYFPHLLTEDCLDERTDYNSIVCNDSVVLKRVIFYNQKPFGNFSGRSVHVRRTTGTGQLYHDVEILDPNDSNSTIIESQVYPSTLAMTSNSNKHIGKTWAIPFVMGHRYELLWGDTNIDWTRLMLELFNWEVTDWIHLSFNFIEAREMFTVDRGSATACDEETETCPREIENNRCDLTALLDDFMSDPSVYENPAADVGYYGDHAFNNETDVRQFDVIVNGKDQDDVRKGDHITIYGHKCWGLHCDQQDEILVIDDIADIIVSEDGVISEEFLWSDEYIWDYRTRSGWTLNNTGMPQIDDQVIVASNWNMTLDVPSTPVLESLEIQGTLIFDPSQDVILRAKRIHIRDGQLVSGAPWNRTTVKHEIHLYGELLDTHLVFDGELAAGNKVLAVTGELNLYGVEKKPWVRLATNAYADDTVIFTEDVTTDDGNGWSVGDQIVIAPSGYSMTEFEEMEIEQINVVGATDADFVEAQKRDAYGQGYGQAGAPSTEDYIPYGGTLVTKITLKEPLKYYHAGVKLAPEFGKDIDVRAAVGNLSRNIVIKSIMTTNALGVQEWNGNVMVASYWDFNTAPPFFIPELREGAVNLHNVEIDGMGQYETYRAGLRFVVPVGVDTFTKKSTVENCVMKDSDTFGVYIENWKGAIDFKGNIVFKNWQQGIYAKNVADLNLENNLSLYTRQAPHLKRIISKSSNFFICADSPHGCTGVKFAGNYAGGADFTAMMVPAHPCGSGVPGFQWGEGNYAQSSMVCWRYTQPGYGNICHDVQLTSFKCNSGGIMSKAGASRITLKNQVVVDMPKGISLVPAGDGYTEVADNVIIGRSIHSYCSSSCSGECGRRIGSTIGVYRPGAESVSLTSKMKTALDNPKGTQAWGGEFYWNNNAYINFQQSGCNNNFCLYTNDAVTDKYAINTYENIKLKNVDIDNSVVWMNPRPESDIAVESCGWFVCSAADNVMAYSKDGSLFHAHDAVFRREEATPGIFIPRNLNRADRDICADPIESMNSIKCLYPGQHRRYVMLVTDSLDGDTMERVIGPTAITTEGLYGSWTKESFFNNTLNEYHQDGVDASGFYQAQKRRSRFPGIVETDRWYNVTYTGTLPGSMRYQLQGTESEDEGIIITVPYVRPETVRVSVGTEDGKKEVEGTVHTLGQDIDALVTTASPTGANQWFYSTNKIKFSIKGSQMIYLDIIDSIQLQTRLSVTSEEFWANSGPTDWIDRMAAVLNIQPYRVRVVDVYEGSVWVAGYIGPDDSLADTSDAETGGSGSLAELARIQDLLIQKAQNNELNMPYPLMEFSAKVVAAPITDDTDSSSDSDSTDSDSSDSEVVISFDVEDVGEDGTSGSLSLVSGDSDSDDKWYEPLSFNQIVAVMIGGGFILIGSILLIIVVFCKRKVNTKVIHSPSPSDAGQSLFVDGKPMLSTHEQSGSAEKIILDSPKHGPAGMTSERTELSGSAFNTIGQGYAGDDNHNRLFQMSQQSGSDHDVQRLHSAKEKQNLDLTRNEDNKGYNLVNKNES